VSTHREGGPGDEWRRHGVINLILARVAAQNG